MVKVLVCGDIEGEWSIFYDRISSLQNSKHGPFDLLFCTGSFFRNLDDYNEFTKLLKLPLPTYIFDENDFPEEGFASSSNLINLGPVGVKTISNLTVAYMRKDSDTNYPVEYGKLHSMCFSPKYRGCDIFLSSDWPKDIQNFIESR